ncbi:MAG: cytochrome c [Anaerolineae bacterium]|nr:cytochrome c [Anaerolineae bacterium]
MKFLIPLLILILLLIVAACSEAQTISSAPANGDIPINGEQIFVSYCSPCHGPSGEGIAGLGKPLNSSEFVAGLSDAELLAFIKTGRPADDPLNTSGVAMPPKGGNPALTDEQLQAIVAYLRSIHTP